MTNAVPWVLGEALLSNGHLAVLAGNTVSIFGSNSNNWYYSNLSAFDKLQVAIIADSTPVSLNQTSGLPFASGVSPNMRPSNPDVGGGTIAALSGGGMAVMTWGNTNNNYYLELLDNSGNITKAPTVIAGGTDGNNLTGWIGSWSGGLVVAWSENDASAWYYQRYDNSGNTVGSTHQLNPGSYSYNGTQNYSLSAMAVDSLGDVVFTNSSADVFHAATYQEYNASGTLIASGSLHQDQWSPGFVAAPGGGFEIASYQHHAGWNTQSGYSTFNLYVDKLSATGTFSTVTSVADAVNVPSGTGPISASNMGFDGNGNFFFLPNSGNWQNPATSFDEIVAGTSTIVSFGTPQTAGLAFATRPAEDFSSSLTGVGINASNQLVLMTLGSALPSNPVVSSINRHTGALALTNAGTVSFDVTFNMAVTGVAAADFAVAGTGTATGSVGTVTGSGANYTITVTGVSGNGTLTLNQAAVGSIANPDTGALTGTHAGDQSYTIDTTAPTITGVTLNAGTYALGSTVTATITTSAYDGNGAYALTTGTIDGMALTGWSYNTSTHAGTASFIVIGSSTEVIGGTVATNLVVSDAAGNASSTYTAAITNTIIDTHAPTALALSSNTVYVGAGTVVGTLSPTDASNGESFTYALVNDAGTPANSANNASFVLSGNTLSVGASPLTAGTDHVEVKVTDAGGNTFTQAFTVSAVAGPAVTSINRAGTAALTNAASDNFTVTFSMAVNGVASSNFTLTGTDGTGTVGTPVSGDGGITWTVPVTGVTGNGTLGLNLSTIGSIVSVANGAALTGTHTGDQSYTIDNTAPALGNLNSDSEVFVIGSSAVLLDAGANATVTEANIAAGSTLTASIANVIGADESLGIKNIAGGITTSVAGGVVTIKDNGTTIGSYNATGTGSGSSGNDMVVTLSAGDTATQVQDLLRALTYVDSNASATAQDRTVNITLTDAVGNVSANSAVSVHDDNRPVVTAGHTPSVVRTAAAAVVDSAVSLSATGAIWTAGTLVVQITANADASHDTLSLPSANPGGNAVWLDLTGNKLMAGSTQIGTADANSTTGGSAWTFTFNANATTALVQAAVDAVRLAVAAGGSVATRTIAFTANDGYGVASNTATDSINVLAEPTISGGGSHAVNDNANITPLSGVTIADGSSEGVTVTITFAATAGSFTGSTGWTSGTSGSNATYTKSFASVSAANAGLAALSFAPTAHLGNVGTSQNVTFNVSAIGNTTSLSTGTDSAASANVTYVNTAPTLTAGGGSTPSYTTGQAAVTIDGGLLLTDPDNGGIGNWSGGSLLVHISANADVAHDTLSITSAGGITIVGNAVSYNNSQIGTIHSEKTGAPGKDLLITFAGSATDVAVKALAEAIQFGGTGITTNGSTRSIAFTVTDASGATSSATDSINLVLGPSVLSIMLDANTRSVTNAKTVTFDVAFSAGMTGITAADFTLAKSGTATGSIASVTGSGANWTVTASGVSGNGTLTLNQTATATGHDGNGKALVGSHGGDQSVTIDNTPPIAPNITGLTAATDTGTSNQDGVTNVTTPTVQGTAEAGSTVTVYVDKIRSGTANVDGSGNWTFNVPTALQQGSHAVTARATDMAGNSGAISAGYNVSILTTSPIVMAYLTNDSTETSTEQEGPAWGIAGPPDDGDYEMSASLSGTGMANTTVTFWDGGTWVNGVLTGATQIAGNATANAMGRWTFTPASLTQGPHTIVAEQIDAAGNIGYSGRGVYFVYDTAAPSLTMTLATDSGSSSFDKITNNPVLSGTADGDPDANGVVTLKEGSIILGSATVAANGTWSFAPTALAQGAHTITAIQTDYAGNIGTTSLNFTYDSAAPVVTMKLLSDTGSSSSDRITAVATLTGSGDANATVTIKEGSSTLGTTTANGAGVWTFTPGLSQGNHVITASETDIAGNTGTKSLTVTYDSQSPSATWQAATSNLPILPSATALAPGSAIAILSATGGQVGDKYGFSLASGSSTGLSLLSTGSTALLSAGQSGLAGATGGKLYTALVTVTDTTSGTSTTLAPLGVVVGNSGADTINLRTLNIAATTPTFVYGLSGTDTIIGTGMNAALNIIGGAGADIMTGGSGANTYLYGAASESTASAMDIITNFASQDLIDLSGVMGLTTYQGQVTTTVAPHSVGWQISSGNTFVYSNTSNASELIGAANMKIELLGNHTLTAGNFAA